MIEKTEIEQLWANYRKAFVAEIRLKHSMKADNEINKQLPRAQREFEKQVQQGVLPAPPSLQSALRG